MSGIPMTNELSLPIPDTINAHVIVLRPSADKWGFKHVILRSGIKPALKHTDYFIRANVKY